MASGVRWFLVYPAMHDPNPPPHDALFFVQGGESTLTHRERGLLSKLQREYTPDIAASVLRPLLTQESPVSLRVLDWAVVNWSKQHNVVCASLVPGETTTVHYAYRSALGFWKRRLFDPFRRRMRVSVRIGDEVHETTLGQANFVLWAYHTGVLAYVLCHVRDIEADQNRVSQRQKRERRECAKAGRKKRRQELTPSSGTMCVAYRVPAKVRF